MSDSTGNDTLRTLLDGRWVDLRERTRKRLGVLEAPAPGLSREEHREHVLRQLRVLASSGHSSVGFPVRHGGDGDFGGSVVAFEMLGFGDLSLMVKAGVQWGLFGGAVQALGTEAHHERYLREIVELDLLGCFAMTESGHGSDVQHLTTTATYDADTGEFVVHTPNVHARKDYIGNAARDGQVAVVFAQLITGGEGHGVHALLVPIREPNGSARAGVTIEDCGEKAGLNGVDNGRLSFDNVRVPREALLDRYGRVAEDGTYSSPIDGTGKRFFTMLGTLVRGRVSVAGGALSATKKALTIAVRHGDTRKQFTKPDGTEVPVLDYLAHQRRLLPALATTYALNFAQEELVSELHAVFGGDASDDQRQRELESQAAGLKAMSTWHATRTIQTCREACGGAGYLAENQLPQLKADTDVFTTFEGDNTVLLQLVAKGLLTGYRDHVGDLDTLGMARFVATQLVGAVIERTPVRALLGGDVRDRAWQLKLFTDREEHVLDGLVRRLRNAGEDNAFEVFNNAQDHVLRAARTHVDRIVLEAFVAAIDRCPDSATAELLDRVCDLHVLANVEEDLAWFLGHGRLTTAKAKSITSEVNSVCAELRPRAAELVEAFGVPMEWITAPIARR
ncbi:acyl-CoA dehydrogenase [Allokutzneria sp. NRRL B-24872]|uniref:acyl-CoA dehydrogenase family protein n=1 Tax=Allokutzneria sp. NRRL B-24872 TaxID=1137961 RepID=UPI000A37596A|nr:acyl-CoA dehydrogenase [Allokutzneria sp. NRRL B-24872]